MANIRLWRLGHTLSSERVHAIYVPLVALTLLAAGGCCWFLVETLTSSTFGLKNEVVYHFLAPYFFVFGLWNGKS